MNICFLLRHAHIEYYGECRQIADCSEDDLIDFPRRMREWMFNVMKELAERDEISPHYKQLEQEAESDQSRKWGNAAVWQWCNLDKHPHDNVVSRHELFPLKAPLHTLEHCLAPFLDTCDKDTDHMVTLEVSILHTRDIVHVLDVGVGWVLGAGGGRAPRQM